MSVIGGCCEEPREARRRCREAKTDRVQSCDEPRVGGEPAGVAAPRSRAELVRIAAKGRSRHARCPRRGPSRSGTRSRCPTGRNRAQAPTATTAAAIPDEQRSRERPKRWGSGRRVVRRVPLSRAAGINLLPRSVFEPRSSRRRDPVARRCHFVVHGDRSPGGVSAVARHAANAVERPAVGLAVLFLAPHARRRRPHPLRRHRTTAPRRRPVGQQVLARHAVGVGAVPAAGRGGRLAR